MTHIDAMKQGLEALEVEDMACRYEKEATPEYIAKAIASLRQAIAAAEKKNALQSLHAENERLGLYKDAYAEQEPVAIDGNTSDGYHTFNELYEFRKAYNAALFNEWSAGGKCSVHKSWRHHDGELCFGGGWFIVVAVLPNGQISNHYEAKDWDLFNIPETECALFEFDGHTSTDVVTRLNAYANPPQHTELIQNLQCFHCQDTIETLNDKVMRLLAQRKPLTDEQITEGWRALPIRAPMSWSAYEAGVRMAEAAHGIKGEA